MNAEDQIVICAIAKQEYDFVYDWVAWHLRIGFDKIYIYDNNDPDGERYDELLKKWIDKDQVELIDRRGIQGIQIKSYNEFYNTYKFKWVAFIDLDEFFYFKPDGEYNNIKDFVEMKDDAEAYMIFWELYGSHDLNKKGHIWDICEKLPWNARKAEDYNLNYWHKSIIKSGLDIKVNEHAICSGYGVRRIYNDHGDFIDSQINMFHDDYDHSNPNLCVNHYIIRDIDTFFYKKYLRGHAGFEGSGGVDGRIPYTWNQNLDYYVDVQRYISQQDQEYLYSKGIRPSWTFHPTMIIIVHLLPGSPEFSKGIYDYLYKVRGSCDGLIKICIDTDLAYGNPKKAEEYGIHGGMVDQVFNYDRLLENQWWDSPGGVDLSRYENYFVQEPLVLHIGYPFDDEFSFQVLEDFTQNFEWIARNICFYHPHDSILFTPKALVQNDPTDNLFIKETEATGMRLYHKRLMGNIFITNQSTYVKIEKFFQEFTGHTILDNKAIQENTKACYATYYNKYNFLWPGLVDNIIEI